MSLSVSSLYLTGNFIEKELLYTGWTKKKGVLKKQKSAMVGVF